MSLTDRLLAYSAAAPERRAVVCDSRVLDYRALASKALACAGRLQALGLQAGGSRSVGLLAASGIDGAVVVMACQLAGIPVVPLPVLITPDAQAGIVTDAGVDLLFHDGDFAAQAHAIADRLSGRTSVSLIALSDEWLSEQRQFAPVAIHDDWISDLIYSSGTTGNPKGITQTFGGRKAQCVSLAQLGLAEGHGLLNTIGLYSNFGFSSLLLAIWWGSTLFMMRKFSASDTVETLTRERVDLAWFAPATLMRTVAAPGFLDAVAGNPASKLCAGAPLSVAQKQRILEDWPGPFFEVYGQTETGTLTLFPMHAAPASKLGSVGKVLPTASVRIIDDSGRIVATGEEGEIVGHSTTLMSGYHAKEDASFSAQWTDDDGRRYVRSGDIGRIDADGYLWLCDRKKDMIISGGYNIYPADIERTLQEHPAVFEVAVVGVDSRRWGETPVAFLTLRNGAEAEEDDLRAWVNERVGAIQRVALVRILPELPSGSMGKILKRELRDRFAAVLGTLP